MADVTGLWRGSGRAAAALAGLAEHRGLDVEVALGPEDHLVEVELDPKQRVLPPLAAGPRAALRAAARGPEEGLEDVAEAAETAPSTTERPASAEVVLLTLLRIAQNVIGVRHELELVGRLLARVHIRMQLPRQPAVCALDLVGARIAIDTENFIMIGHLFLVRTFCHARLSDVLAC